LFSAEAEELSLFSPAGRQPRRQAHQCLGAAIVDGAAPADLTVTSLAKALPYSQTQ
jgi:hypothetical protein